MNALSIAATGLINAGNRFDASARRMVSGEGDLATEVVEQVSEKTAFKASLAVIRAEDEMFKRLLDIKA